MDTLPACDAGTGATVAEPMNADANAGHGTSHDAGDGTGHGDGTRAVPGAWGGVVAAALLLSGGAPVFAEEPPAQAEIAAKFLSYRDRQPGLDRIKVNAPSVYLMVPFAGRWSVEGSVVTDSVSGASPRYHSAISGASRLDEYRKAGDVRLTRYNDRDAWSVGAAYSIEHDYRSRTLSADYRRSSEDNNRSWNIGAAYSNDWIGSSDDPTLSRSRNTLQMIAGVTQAWTANDLLQFNLGGSWGHGFYNDPYKFPDRRPDTRDQYTAMLRWNHHFQDWKTTLRSSWRYYADSYGVRANTLETAWVQPLRGGWTVTPLLRYTTQRAARFYYDPVYDPTLGAPFPPGYTSTSPQYISGDHRLSAFGAVTAGLKVAYEFRPRWVADLSIEHYEQRADWRLGGHGSPGLDRFQADWLQVGISHKF
ncbi:DUF3570 domain-containing protein [Roseateles sp. SL47]|uniref:DUF3570 domain-containing protein n=1 Tax=Roseateles sp. SL47 TaxID=2995138 RepID=UPI002271C48B|nr:DUF3570 domain-containing protein [Roseateles sp. SL47]WAC71633.1 DUF3570 domain-containing protein [Roseateles sp. SL47]